MQLSSLQSRLSWLFLPAIAVALVPASDDSQTIGNNVLDLVTPQNLSTTPIDRVAYCKHDPDDPDDPDGPWVFTSSLNYTFPSTPPINESFLAAAGLRDPDVKSKPFDCFIELPGGLIVFEFKGELDSDGTLVFEVWIEVLFFNYKVGPYRCNIFTLDKDPCTFDIPWKILNGQGGLYPEPDEDPKLEDLCFKIDATLKLPYRSAKHLYFQKCFWKFRKPEKSTNVVLGSFTSTRLSAQS